MIESVPKRASYIDLDNGHIPLIGENRPFNYIKQMAPKRFHLHHLKLLSVQQNL